MSFGFSIGDIIKLVEITNHTYKRWKNACGTYAKVTDDLAVLRTLLPRIEAEAKTPSSLFSSNTVDIQHWRTLSKDCYRVIKELDSILDKHKSLGTSRARNWDRIRLSDKKLDSLESRLSRKIAGITAFVGVIGVSSQGRVENVEFREIKQKMDNIAAGMRRGNGSICTVSTYEDDDKFVWKDFRREMIRDGVKSGDIHKHGPALKAYMLQLKHNGSLDEEEISQIPQEEVHRNPLQEKTVIARQLVDIFQPKRKGSLKGKEISQNSQEGVSGAPPKEKIVLKEQSLGLIQVKHKDIMEEEEEVSRSSEEEVSINLDQKPLAVEEKPSHLLQLEHKGSVGEEYIPKSFQEGVLGDLPQKDIAIEERTLRLLQLKHEDLADEEEMLQCSHEELCEMTQQNAAIEERQPLTHVRTISPRGKLPAASLSDGSESCGLDTDDAKSADSSSEQDPHKTVTTSSKTNRCQAAESIISNTTPEHNDCPTLQPRSDTIQTAKKNFNYGWLSTEWVRIIKDPSEVRDGPKTLLYGCYWKTLKDYILVVPVNNGGQLLRDCALQFLARIRTSARNEDTKHQLEVLPASRVSSQLLGRFNSGCMEDPGISCLYRKQVSFLQSSDETIERNTAIYWYMEWNYAQLNIHHYLVTSQFMSEYLSEAGDETFPDYAKRILES